MAQDNKVCQVCGELGHSKFYCKKRPRTPIKKSGKKSMAWQEFRVDWYKRHPAPYYCYYCKIEYPLSSGAMTKKQTTLDHYLPRGSYPGLALVDSNIVPCCWFHNGDKGSIHGDKYVEQIKKRASA